jgi:hypothetical protein
VRDDLCLGRRFLEQRQKIAGKAHGSDRRFGGAGRALLRDASVGGQTMRRAALGIIAPLKAIIPDLTDDIHTGCCGVGVGNHLCAARSPKYLPAPTGRANGATERIGI